MIHPKDRWSLFASLIILLVIMAGLPLGAGAGEQLPLGAAMCINKVESLIQKGKLQEAVIVLENFKAKQKGVDPGTAEKKGYTHYYIDFLLGNTCLMCSEKKGTGKTGTWLKRAARAYDQAVKKKPDLSPAWLNLAKCRYDLDQMNKAARAFVKGYDASPEKNASHLYYGAICYFQANDHSRALKTFNRLIKKHPKSFSPAWRENYVSILFAMDKNKTALPHVEILAGKFTGEKKKKWQEILLYQYLNLKMSKKALAYGKMLTRTDPTEPKWWKAVSHLYLNRNDMKNGLSNLLIYSYLTPPTREEKILMADLYLSLGIPARASVFYEKILKDKEDLTKIKRIIQAYTASHEPEKALAWIDRGLAWKSDFDLLKQKAAFLYELEQYDKAASVYEQLAGRSKRPGEYFLLLGYCAWNLEQMDRAKKAFERAAKFDKQKKSALLAIAQLSKMVK
ncbi:Tetratricopeptide repeat-containing protein [Desulfocicer vacuolatum DSM 3385]|uniref:Tetratricopeptide repeat-containing protein n=2 Tax=Desulfocicer vacuolatum TaxID=2298 RepID=A0A1W1YTM6_9BACT|nr:Tetratricopeptide repeat-containing protein [Desulfocicer vacuolatum DSM 3385]